MWEIRQLDKKLWENFELQFSYSTDGYYSFEVNEWDFQLKFHPYETILQKSFTDHLFSRTDGEFMAFGAFYDDTLVGVMECFLESWNNRFRITNLLVFENFRGKGIGTSFINKAVEIAEKDKARMIVLETQTCNRKAIDFYLKMGFQPVGFDLFCYTNEDPDKTEVRLEMAKRIDPADRVC